MAVEIIKWCGAIVAVLFTLGVIARVVSALFD